MKALLLTFSLLFLPTTTFANVKNRILIKTDKNIINHGEQDGKTYQYSFYSAKDLIKAKIFHIFLDDATNAEYRGFDYQACYEGDTSAARKIVETALKASAKNKQNYTFPEGNSSQMLSLDEVVADDSGTIEISLVTFEKSGGLSGYIDGPLSTYFYLPPCR